MPSCLAESAETSVQFSEPVPENAIAVSEGTGRVRRGAAMVSLAISMSATGMLLPSQHKAVLAVEPITSEAATPSLPPTTTTAQEFSSQQQAPRKPLAAPEIKHTVKQGESLWKLARSYQVAPSLIAAANDISPSSELIVGQSINIPSPSVDSHINNPEAQNSLSQLKSKPANLKTELAAVPTEVASGAIEIPVPAPETGMPTPKSLERIPKINREANPQTLPALSNQESVSAPTPPRFDSANLSRPTPIPVPSPETAAITNYNRGNIEPDKPKALEISPQESNPSLPFENLQPQVIPTAKQQVYQVQSGDTLNTIARRYGLSVAKLIQANGIDNPNLIKIHQNLVIPQRSSARNSRQVPTAISTLPGTGSQVPSAQFPLPKPPAPMALRSTSPVRSANPPENFNQSPAPQEAIAIPVEAPPTPYRENFKAEIVSLQREYQQDNPTLPLSEQSPSSAANTSEAAVVGEAINPEWANNSQTLSNQASLPAQPSEKPQNQGSRIFRETTLSKTRSQSQLVGAAPTNAEQYNELIHLPAGETVGPELPPLSSPENYLPNAPMHFTGYIWPAKGVLTSGFGRRWGRPHKGIDIAAPIGTPILAAAPGEVVSAGWNSGGYGNLVKVRHADGSLTLYAHNSRILVRRGQQVEQGQQIAEMGSTGFSTGPHLHFEVHPNGGSAVNPIAYLPSKKRS